MQDGHNLPMGDSVGLVSLSRDVAQCEGRVDPEAPPSIFYDDASSQVQLSCVPTLS